MLSSSARGGGSWTHRMIHFPPPLANTPNTLGDYWREAFKGWRRRLSDYIKEKLWSWCEMWADFPKRSSTKHQTQETRCTNRYFCEWSDNLWLTHMRTGTNFIYLLGNFNRLFTQPWCCGCVWPSGAALSHTWPPPPSRPRWFIRAALTHNGVSGPKQQQQWAVWARTTIGYVIRLLAPDLLWFLKHRFHCSSVVLLYDDAVLFFCCWPSWSGFKLLLPVPVSLDSSYITYPVAPFR